MTPLQLEYFNSLRISPYVCPFEPELRVTFGNSRKPHLPGIIRGREGVIKSRYQNWTYDQNIGRPSSTQPRRGGMPTRANRPWLKDREDTTVLRAVPGCLPGGPEPESQREIDALEEALTKTRSSIRREARDDAMEFATALHAEQEKRRQQQDDDNDLVHGEASGLDLDSFVSFIRRRVEGTSGSSDAFARIPMTHFRHWFSLLDRDGNGSISMAEFFAIALFESFEAAGYEAGIYSLLRLYPALFQPGAISRKTVVAFLDSHGFNVRPEQVADEIIGMANQFDWKRRAEPALVDEPINTNATTGDDLLRWFREIVRPIQLHGRAGPKGEHLPTLRDLIHLLAHSHRVRDRENRAAIRERMRLASSLLEDQGGAGTKTRLGFYVPTEQDRLDAEAVARYCRNELGDEGRAQLLAKIQEWDLDGSRTLDLKEFYQSMIISMDGTGIRITPAAMQVLFDSMDDDGDGKIRFTELEQWLDVAMLKLRLALRRVRIFANLSESDIIKLQRAMRELAFERDEWVFRQGDVGDTFFVVLSGAAEVLRNEQNDSNGGENVCLAKLEAGDFFGERCMMKNEVRYAGIKATGSAESEGLETMSITRKAFESVLGPLQTHVPDKY